MPTDTQLYATLAVFLMVPVMAAAGSMFGGVVTCRAVRDVSFASAYRTHFFVNALFLVVAVPLDLMVQLGETAEEGALGVRLVLIVVYNLTLALALCRRYGLGFAEGLRVVIAAEALALRIGGVGLGLMAAYALGGLV